MMKKIAILCILFVALLFPVKALASQTPKITTLPRGEAVDGDHIAVGEMVEISGTVEGDLYVFGGSVLIDGEVKGDVIAAAGMVSVSGRVGQDIRIAGGQITISGDVNGNSTLVGGDIFIADSAKINGGLVVVTGNALIESSVSKNIKALAGNITFTDRIEGSVEAGVGNMRFTSSSSVGGNIKYWSDEEASIDAGATISGIIERSDIPEELKPPTEREIGQAFKTVAAFVKLSSFLTSILIGLLIIHFLPRYSHNASKLIADKFWRSVGVGLVAAVLVPLVAIIFASTLVGIPVSIALFALFILYVYLARIYAMLAFGKKLIEITGVKLDKPGYVYSVGVVSYFLLTLVPIVGGVLKILVVTAGLGAALVNEKNTYTAGRKAKIL